jgi:predicted aspartyl protease
MSKDAPFQSRIIVTGIGGSEEQRCSTLSSMSLGPIVYQNTFACVSPSLTADNFVLVGYDFLKQFDFVFDYPEDLFIMKPHGQ